MGPRVIGYVWLSKLLPSRMAQVEWFTVLEYRCEALDDAPPDLVFRWATAADAGLLTSLGLGADEVRRRVRDGDRAMVCLDASGALLAYAWYRTGVWDECGIRFALAGDEAWAYDFDAVSTVRGRRLLGHIGCAGGAALAAEGIDRVLGGVDVANRGVLRAFLRRTAAPIGEVVMARVGGLSLRREAWDGGRARVRLYWGHCEVSPPSRSPAPGALRAESLAR